MIGISRQKSAATIQNCKPTIGAMDAFLRTYKKAIGSKEVCETVLQVFQIDLDRVEILDKNYTHFPGPRDAIDSYLKQADKPLEGADYRLMLKQIFGINLDGIAELHTEQISLYSKDQWMVKNDDALFHVHTGRRDVDVKIFPTAAFKKQTGIHDMPEILKTNLGKLGYTYLENETACSYEDPSGNDVPSHFKVQTMKTIINYIQSSNENRSN